MIIKLIIENLIPLLNKGTKRIELTPDECMNIVVGRNGFGKSALLREVSPLPPDNSRYAEGGYKEIHYYINKKHYILKSWTGKNSDHSFLIDGNEQNEGGTLTVQRDLVRIHFGVTPKLFDVVSGLDDRTLFTTMSSGKRKEVLQDINPNDTSFGIETYDKLKREYNSTKGALSNQRKRLAAEIRLQESFESMDPEAFEAEINLLDEQLKNAILIHGQLLHVKDPELSKARDELAGIIQRLRLNDSKITMTKHDLLVWLERASLLNTNYQVKIKTYTDKIVEITDKINGLDVGNFSLENTKTKIEENTLRIKDIEKTLENLKANLNRIYVSDELLTKDYAFFFFMDDFINVLKLVEIASDKSITSAFYKKEVIRSKELTNKRNNLKNEIEDLQHYIRHYEKSEDVSCPKCETKFKLGFENFNIVETKNKLASITESLKITEESLDKLTRYLEANEPWFNTMESLYRLTSQTEYASTYIKLIKELDIGKQSTPIAVHYFTNLKKYYVEKQVLKTLNEENTLLKAKLKLIEESDINTLYVLLEELNTELYFFQKASKYNLGDIKSIESELEIIEEDEQLRVIYLDKINALEELVLQKGRYDIKRKVEEVIGIITPKKNKMVADLIKVQSLRSVIDSIKTDIIKLEKEEKHLSFLMDLISPTKGFIGSLMNEFVTAVKGNINNIIEPIWATPLYLITEDSELDKEGEAGVELKYNFPACTGMRGALKDVNDSSKGEAEIFNWAFRKTLREYLKVPEALPLHMDEVGVNFDDLHRSRFGAYLDEQYRIDKLPQTFMISHYAEQYGIMSNANIIALNTEGLKIPFETNRSTKIN